MATLILLFVIVAGAAFVSWLYGYMDDRREEKLKANDKLIEQRIENRVKKMRTLPKFESMEEWKAFSQNFLDEALEDLNGYSDKSSPNYKLLLDSYYKMKEIHDRIFNLQ